MLDDILGHFKKRKQKSGTSATSIFPSGRYGQVEGLPKRR